MKKILILIGPPGSGKGTQASFLKRQYGFEVIVMGNLLREASQLNDDNALKIKKSIEEGVLVDYALVAELLKKALIKSETNKIVLDGYPRSEEQFKLFITLRKILKIQLTLLLDIQNKETIFTRILNRLQCNVCGELSSTSGEDLNYCKYCNNLSCYKRVDDNRSTIERRILQYQEDTIPFLKKHKKELNLLEIDAMNPIGQVSNYVAHFVDKYYFA